MTYAEFIEISLKSEVEGLFDDNPYGVSEAGFTKWLNEQRLFKRFHPSYTALHEVILTERKWQHFTLKYETKLKNAFFVENYPEGYFEGIDKDGVVVCLLPEPSDRGRGDYRLSYYDRRGPISHSVHRTRNAALENIAGRFEYAPGALDKLVGTKDWNIGIQNLRWLADSLTPFQGYQRDKHIPEIANLYQGIFT